MVDGSTEEEFGVLERARILGQDHLGHVGREFM